MNYETISLIKLTGVATIISIIEYVGISPDIISLLTILMVFDVITGIAKRIFEGKKDITSRKMIVGIMAKVFILSLLLLLGWAFKLTSLGSDIAITTVIGLFIAAEFYSCLQNIYTMLTGKSITEYDAFTTIIGGLLSFVKKYIEKTLDLLNK